MIGIERMGGLKMDFSGKLVGIAVKRGASAVAILLLAGVFSGAQAAPEDDFVLGEKAWKESDIGLATSLFKRAADAGHAQAKIMLDYVVGLKAFREGDLLGSMTPLRRAADAGHAPSQALYAYALNKGDENPEALRYYRMAVKQNNADAKYGLAGMLIGAEGSTPGRVTPEDLAEAKVLIFEAAEQGHRQSIAVVVAALLEEKSPLPLSDADKAPQNIGRWLTKLAEFNDLNALRRLEEAHRRGELGFPVNVAEADRLRKQIADLTGETEDAAKPKKRRRR